MLRLVSVASRPSSPMSYALCTYMLVDSLQLANIASCAGDSELGSTLDMAQEVPHKGR